MSGVNKVILVGCLGRDPEVRFTKAGQAVASFSLATSEKWKDKTTGNKEEKTEWHRIIAWGKLAEICGEYLAKGKQVYIEGRLQTREWDDKEGNKKHTTEIVAGIMTMLGQAGSTEPKKQDSLTCPRCKETPCLCPESCDQGFTDEDIPFD